MVEDNNYTLSLAPNSKTRYIAGEFDIKTRTPRYEIEIKKQPHNIVDVVQVMVGTPEKCQWAWEIHNKSSWPIFITVKQDGVVLKCS